MVILEEFLVGVYVIFEDFSESFFDKGVIFFDPIGELELLLEFFGLFGMVEGVEEISYQVNYFLKEGSDFGHSVF